jgi:ABC-type antimicrobial peptide transport system permease subunit
VAAEVHRLAMYPGGKWFSDAGVQELPAAPATGATAADGAGDNIAAGERARPRPAVQVVLGEGIAREMGRYRKPAQLAAARNRERLDVGDSFSLDERTWLVVGVMQSAGSTFDSEVWAKSGVIGPMFGKETYTSVVVRAEDAATARRLKDYFASRYKTVAMQAQVETDYFAALGNSSQMFLYGVAVVAVIMAVGGMFGIMNTMFAAISQRTKDIGVLRLLGYSRGHILVSFLLESLAIALIGGGLGCAIGMMADGWSATSVVSSGPGGGKFVVLRLAVDADIIATGLLLTLGMGVLGGVFPALSAVVQKPLESLR